MPRLSKIGAAALAAFGWTSGSAVSASYLVVAGGGGGGKRVAGAGGAGGFRTGTESLNPTISYTVTVGAGGAGSGVYTSAGTSGSNSVFNTITSAGGGGGGGSGVTNAGSGGSGGGSGDQNTPGSGNTPSTSPSQGNNGGVGSGTASAYGGGGGGGASAVGGNGSSTVAGSGGAGTASSISGSSVTYAGGGGGGSNGGTAGTGGSGGGGAGTTSDSTATAGTANLGGGGGGCGGLSTATGTTFGGQGGSGVVIISYVGAQQFSGGVVTSSGGNTIHTFTTSGTLGPVTPLSANYLVVAGGGGAGFGRGGGGGAGGLLTGSALTIDPYSTYVVTVGAGGIGGTSALKGSNGTNSAFSMVSTAAVGGGGGAFANGNGNAGGSGGGCQGEGQTGGAGTSGQGFAGGNFLTPSGAGTNYVAGGGGGAGAVGANGHTDYTSGVGNGGIGVASSISGTSTYYAGGGGGGANSGGAGTGGTGGGGNGAFSGSGTVGTINSGGGGGGSDSSSAGMAGGSGVVIISYAGSTQLMAGGVVTIAGGNVIHTFNSSGYLTPLTLLTRSLRFRSSASGYINRTFTSQGNLRTWTWSAWVKRGTLTSGAGGQSLFYAGNSTSTARGGIVFGDAGTDKLSVAGMLYNGTTTVMNLVTTAEYRDPASWYHIVVALDTTQATASNRCKMYVNGTQVTAFGTATYPSQNDQLQYNDAILHATRHPSAAYYFDGYMAEVNFIDGQALAPTAFGTFNSYGVWQPITYGGSYGTNGFRLPFTNNASTTTLGYDFSPQGNNWTTNNISVTAGSTYDSMTDVPTLTSATAANYCVLNFLDKTTGTLSNGNLTWYNAASSQACVRSTMAIPTTGKWYWEAYLTNPVGANSSGIALSTFGMASFIGDTNSWAYHTNGYKYVSGVGTAGFGNTGATGNIFSYDFDSSTGTLRGYWNGTLQGTIVTGLPVANYFAAYSSYGGGQWDANFGQRPFTYTPPTGFVALNTFNL